MKNRATGFLKQIMAVLASVAKAKSLALKSKTSAIKTRLIIFSLLRDKKVLVGSLSHKLNALLGEHHLDHDKQSHGDEVDAGEQISCKAIVLCNNNNNAMVANAELVEIRTVAAEQEEEEEEGHGYQEEGEEEEDKYPDLRHSFFELEDTGCSVIELVRNSKEGEGEEFRLEDKIDEVADLFIRRFHRQMRMQKQHSFKRYQEMLQRSV